MITVLGWLGVLVALAFVGWPLVQARLGAEPGEPESLPPLERQKRDALAAIKEAEFDRAMGKLSDEDFATLTARYRAQALDAIAQLDRLQSAATPRPAAGHRAPRFCAQCGSGVPAAANFCAACGTAIRTAATA